MVSGHVILANGVTRCHFRRFVVSPAPAEKSTNVRALLRLKGTVWRSARVGLGKPEKARTFVLFCVLRAPFGDLRGWVSESRKKHERSCFFAFYALRLAI